MKKVIEEVLQIEEKVNADIRQAHARASEIKSAADREVSEKTTAAKEQGREILQAAIENARKEAEKLGQEKIAQAKTEKQALIDSSSDKINKLLDDICKIIITTD